MAYQQPYQPTVNQPVVIQSVQPVQPVVIPVQAGLTGLRRNEGIDLGKCTVPGVCVIYLGFFGFAFITGSIFMLSFDYAFDHGADFHRAFGRTQSPMRAPMFVVLTIGVIFAVITVGLCLIHKRNKRRQESQDNTQPVSEPFTQNQMNQGTPMYVPVSSGPGPIPYSDNATSAPLGFDTSTGSQQKTWPENVSTAAYDQPPPFAPPPYSS